MSEVLSSSSEQVQQQEDSSNIDYRCAAAQDRQAFSSMVNEYHRREQERRKTLTVRRRLANREKRKEDHRVFLMERFSLHSEGGDAATTLQAALKRHLVMRCDHPRHTARTNTPGEAPVLCYTWDRGGIVSQVLAAVST